MLLIVTFFNVSLGKCSVLKKHRAADTGGGVGGGVRDSRGLLGVFLRHLDGAPCHSFYVTTA